MSDLETTLRRLAAAGELTYLSVCPVAGRGPGGIEFHASYSPAGKWGHGFGRHADPVEAIKMAIHDPRFAALVKKLGADAPEQFDDFGQPIQ
jgi:hypothetical protein